MQGVLLHILVAMGVLQSHHFWLETENVGEAYQKVLVCVEMMFIAVLHQYAYHAAPYSGDVEAKLKLQKKHEWLWIEAAMEYNFLWHDPSCSFWRFWNWCMSLLYSLSFVLLKSIWRMFLVSIVLNSFLSFQNGMITIYKAQPWWSDETLKKSDYFRFVCTWYWTELSKPKPNLGF